MKLSELQPKQSEVNVEVEVIDLSEVREFTKFGRVGRVCTATVKDDSAQMNMTLWNDDIDKVKVGDNLKLTNGFVNEWQGELQLTTGRAGQLEVLEGQAKLAPAKDAEPKADEPAEKAAEPAPSVEEPEKAESEAPEEVKEEVVDVEEEFIE